MTIRLFLIAACVISVAAVSLLAMQNTNFVVIPWVSSLCAYVYFFHLSNFKTTQTHQANPHGLIETSEWVVVAILTLVAVTVRCMYIETFPYLLHNDEAGNGINARTFLDTPPYLFSTGGWNFSHLSFWMSSLGLHLPVSELAGVRLVSVFFGIISLLSTYAIVRLLSNRPTALLLLFVNIGYHWHLHFSRMGLNNIYAAAYGTLCVALFLYSLESQNKVPTALSGITLAIGLHTYDAIRLIPIILGVISLWKYFSDTAGRKVLPQHIGILIGGLCLAYIPQAIFYLQHPDVLVGRAATVSIFSSENQNHLLSTVETTNKWKIIGIQSWRLLALFWEGRDTSVQYGYTGAFLDPVLRLLTCIGFICLLCSRKYRCGGAILAVWCFLTLFVGGAFTIDAPFVPRLVGIASLVNFFGCFALGSLYLFCEDNRIGKYICSIAIALLCGFSVLYNLNEYFFVYPKQQGFSIRETAIRLATELKPASMIMVQSSPETPDHEAFIFMVPTTTAQWLSDTSRLEEAVAHAEKPLLVIGSATEMTTIKNASEWNLFTVPVSDHRYLWRLIPQ